MIRHYFASANSSTGFINYFDYINTTKNCYRYIIKGSSGCGKSTLMKKIAEHFLSLGYSLEYFYCSSDPSSLDGIRIVDFDISIVDGTSPHATEATAPSVLDEIVNLGEFISNNAIFNKDKILDIISKKKNNYSSIYSLLSAIGKIDETIRKPYENYTNFEIEKWILNNCAYNHKKIAKIRKLFLSALDTNGINDLTIKNEFKTILLPLNKYEFSVVVDKLINNIIGKGNDLTLFYDIFSPENCVGYLLNDKIYYTFDNNKILSDKEKDLEEIINLILKNCSITLSETRNYHFELEKLYSDFIDYKALDKTFKSLKNNIEKRIDKIKNFN